MKLVYLSLLVILLPLAFASLSEYTEESAQLKSSVAPKPKPVTGTSLVARRKKKGTKPKPVTGTSLVVKRKKKGTKPKPATGAKPKKPSKAEKSAEQPTDFLSVPSIVKLVIDYFKDDAYSLTSYEQDVPFKSMPDVAVDRAKLYLISSGEGIKSIGAAEAIEGSYVELGRPEWFDYHHFASSQDGNTLLVSYAYKMPVDGREHTKYATQLLMESSGILSSISLDTKGLNYTILSKDGQTLLAACLGALGFTTCIYRLKESPESGKELALAAKFTNCKPMALSGNGSRVMVISVKQYFIRDVDTGKVAFQVDGANLSDVCALNEDGSEAAFFTQECRLQVAKAGATTGVATSVISGGPVLTARIEQLVYDDRNSLHVVQNGKVSLYDPSTNELVLLFKVPPLKGTPVFQFAVSPNAEKIVIVYPTGEKEGLESVYKILLWRKHNDAEWTDILRGTLKE